jgi:hypothetical protein
MSRRPPGLVARIRQMRRVGAPADLSTPAGVEPGAGQAADLEARIAHLEQLVEGLQDAMYREAQRQEKRIAEIEKCLDPAMIAAALSRDARERGL